MATGRARAITEDQREKMKEGRKRCGSRAINITTLVRREREPGEMPTRGIAIQNFCRSCLGFEPDNGKTLRQSVLDCDTQSCWLWPYRVSGRSVGGDE